MKELELNAIELFEKYEMEPRNPAWGVYSIINGMKVEWTTSESCLKVGLGNSPADVELIKESLAEYGIECVNKTTAGPARIKNPSLDDLDRLIDWAVNFTEPLENSLSSRRSTNTEKGIVFEGSNFSNAHERATTIGPRFMKMPCEAAGMNLLQMDAEWVVEDGGRIDAVEIDNATNQIVSIYECQSGIQNGDYLDDTHLNKALLRYPADPAIAPTLKKIVILAGGYTKTHMETIKWQAENLKTTRGIEVILLKTTRTNDKIGVALVDFKLA
jgi:hypothetical protein